MYMSAILEADVAFTDLGIAVPPMSSIVFSNRFKGQVKIGAEKSCVEW